MLIFTVGFVSAIYTLKMVLEPHIGFEYAQYVASGLSSMQIAIGNIIANYVAMLLNAFENHRTESQFEDALIAKLFCFQFVNSYSSCFYIAFVAEHQPVPIGSPPGTVGQCGGPDCMQVLSLNLAIIFLVQILKTCELQL